VAGCYKYGDEPAGSGATEFVLGSRSRRKPLNMLENIILMCLT
jgi:hypothetical protein